MKNIIDYISKNPIELLALLFSLINLFLYYTTLRKQKIKLKIIQDDNGEAYNFNFIYYESYDCLFFHVNIVNQSKSDTTITSIELLDNKGNIYTPTQFDECDFAYNEDGIALFTDDKYSNYLTYDLKSENLLNKLRIPSYDNSSGFLVFYEVPIINKSQTYILKIHTAKKIFTKKIDVNPLPENLRPRFSK